MSSKIRAQQIKSNILKSYEACLKQGIPIGKKYGSDFSDGFIVEQYTYPPYPWNISLNNRQNKNQKSIRTSQKKRKVKSISRKNKSKSTRNQRSKSRKR